MKDEFVIINKTPLQKMREKLEKGSPHWSDYKKGQIDLIDTILSQSTPLIPEIEKAIDFGKDCIREHSYIGEDWNNTPIIEYHDSAEEINRYISNLKLDI